MEEQAKYEVKSKKPIYKKWWFWVIVVIVVLGAIGNMGDKNTQTASKPQEQTQEKPKENPKEEPKQEEPKKEEPKVDENKPTINMAEFQKIQNGMSYDDVCKIIGGQGEIMSEVGQKGEQFHTIMYMFKGEGSIGANANFTFQDGKLQAKAQMGLK